MAPAASNYVGFYFYVRASRWFLFPPATNKWRPGASNHVQRRTYMASSHPSRPDFFATLTSTVLPFSLLAQVSETLADFRLYRRNLKSTEYTFVTPNAAPTQPAMLASVIQSPMSLKHYAKQEDVFQLAANLAEKIMKKPCLSGRQQGFSRCSCCPCYQPDEC
jgi:hypothetical protein